MERMYNTFEECRSYFSGRYQYLDVNKTLNLSRKECMRLFNEAVEEYMQGITHSLLTKNTDLYDNRKRLSELDNLLKDRALVKLSSNGGVTNLFSLSTIEDELYSYISFRAKGINKCEDELFCGCTLLNSEEYDKLHNNSIYVLASEREPFVCIRNGTLELISTGNDISVVTVTYLCRPALFYADSTNISLDRISNIKNIKAVLDIALANATLATSEQRWQATQLKQKSNPI